MNPRLQAPFRAKNGFAIFSWAVAAGSIGRMLLDKYVFLVAGRGVLEAVKLDSETLIFIRITEATQKQSSNVVRA